MTREEAEKMASEMPRLQALVHVRNCFDGHTWKGLDVLLDNGDKVGIGNPVAVEAAKKALLDLLDKQILDESAKSGSQA